jgi:hypothetical protein
MKWGFISLPTIIAAALGIGFAASAYLNYAQYQASQQNQKLLQGQIVDLKYQVNQDHLAMSGSTPSPSPSPEANTASTTTSPSPTPSPSSSPAVAGASTVSISQFGVNLAVAEPIADLTYTPITSGGLIVAGFTTESLIAKYPSCKPGTALGMLVRRPPSGSESIPRSGDKFIKQIGAYKFYFVPATSYCASTYAGANELAADRAAMANTLTAGSSSLTSQ